MREAKLRFWGERGAPGWLKAVARVEPLGPLRCDGFLAMGQWGSSSLEENKGSPAQGSSSMNTPPRRAQWPPNTPPPFCHPSRDSEGTGSFRCDWK